MSLPIGYKQLEYIQSSGTQYIDAGFTPNQNTHVIIDVDVLSTSTSPVYGTRDSRNATAFCLWVINSATFRADYNDYKTSFSVSSVTGRIRIDQDKNTCTVGTSTQSVTAATFTCPSSFLIFTCHNASSVESRRVSAKLYSCQIYDNGTLVRDFIPCQKSNGTVGLWDDVNEVFYGNAGTGTFSAGPAVAIAAAASEITELEYIQSSGTQWIDTGFKPNQDTRVVMNCYVISFNSCDMFIFGARVSTGNTAFYVAADDTNTKWFISYGSDVQNPVGTCTGHHSIDMNKNSVSIDDAITTLSASTFQSASNLLLFATNTAGSADSQRGTMNLYSCQIYDNGTIIRDYTPAKLSDGTVGLYDKLNGLLYINAGTGAFISGGYALNLPVNIGGIWKVVEAAFVNIGGTWKELG